MKRGSAERLAIIGTRREFPPAAPLVVPPREVVGRNAGMPAATDAEEAERLRIRQEQARRALGILEPEGVVVRDATPGELAGLNVRGIT